ncbi:MAG: polysaccharide deacetylase family protein [Verrucomicrobia bacterium]|nr:polysaccharide deacetylase family protein [Verrucomicrobiota bacterium]
MRSILLTWDIEEYDVPADFGEPPLQDGGLARGVEIWREWLDLSRTWNAPGTVFCTARITEAAPDLLRETAARGHEIASHGWAHAPSADLRLRPSREALEKISGQPVFGFRSPRLRKVDPGEVNGSGYAYDASLNPAWIPGRYNHRNQPRTPHRIGSLWEVPASVLPVIRFPLFWASFHLLPLPLYLAACRLVLAKDGLLTLYFHPWELSDLPEATLPRWLTRRTKAERILRMADFCKWLGTQGTFRTIADYLALVK